MSYKELTTMATRPNHHDWSGAGSRFWPYFQLKRGNRYVSEDKRFSFEPLDGNGKKYQIIDHVEGKQLGNRRGTTGVPACRTIVHDHLVDEHNRAQEAAARIAAVEESGGQAREEQPRETREGQQALTVSTAGTAEKAEKPEGKSVPELPRAAGRRNLMRVVRAYVALADAEGCARVSVDDIAATAGMTNSPTDRALRYLRDAGYLVQMERGKKGSKTLWQWDDQLPVTELLKKLPAPDEEEREWSNVADFRPANLHDSQPFFPAPQLVKAAEPPPAEPASPPNAPVLEREGTSNTSGAVMAGRALVKLKKLEESLALAQFQIAKLEETNDALLRFVRDTFGVEVA
jgi:hypothetical protein